MFLSLSKKGRVLWTTNQVNEEKTRIKEELDQEAGQTPKARLAKALQKAKDLENDETPTGRLRCFIFIISALVQHQRLPTLSLSQVESLVNRAYAILQTQGIHAGASNLAFLYGEIHQVTSLIYRREGSLWRSAWEQQLAVYLSRPFAVGGEGYQAVAMGNRALRLGNGGLAYWHFSQAEQYELDTYLFYQARIGRVQTQRLAGRWDKARELLDETLQKDDKPVDITKELMWEQLCLESACHADMGPLVQAVKKDLPHYVATYLAEAFLWSAASQAISYREGLPKMSTLARKKELQMRKLGFLFDVCLVLEECYDHDIPLVLRLKKLGIHLSQANRLLNIDKELLVWAAAARWLSRIKSYQLAALALSQYQNLCLSLSDREMDDVFQMMGSLLTADWYLKSEWRQQENGHLAPSVSNEEDVQEAEDSEKEAS